MYKAYIFDLDGTLWDSTGCACDIWNRVLEKHDDISFRMTKEKAEQLAMDEGAWLNMLQEGATTTFEAWGKAQKWNTSLFHPWATAPLIVFAKDTEAY